MPDVFDIRGVVSADVSPFSRAMDTTALDATSAFSRMGAAANQFIGGSVVRAFISATEAANKFGQSIADISAIATNDMADLKSKIMGMADVYGKVTDISEAMYETISSGIRGSNDEYVHFMQTARQTAVSIKADLYDTVNVLTTMLNAYGAGIRDVERYSDMLFTTVREGKAHGRDLTKSLGLVIGTAAEVGLSLEEVMATIATLSRTQTASQAMIGFNQLLNSIIKPTQEASRVARQYGIDLSFTALKTKGLVAVLDEIRTKTAGNLEAINTIMGPIRAMRAGVSLTGKQFDEFVELVRVGASEIGSGVAYDAFIKQTNTAAQAVENLSVKFDKFKVVVGEDISPIAEALVGTANRVLTAFNDTSGWVRWTFYINTVVLSLTVAVKAIKSIVSNAKLTADATHKIAKALDGSTVGTKSLAKDLASANRNITSISSKSAKTADHVTTASNGITSINRKLKNTDTRTTTVASQVKTIRTDLKAVNTTVTSIDTRTANVASHGKNIRVVLKDVNTTVTSIYAKSKGILTTTTELNKNINRLSAHVSKLSKGVATFRSNISKTVTETNHLYVAFEKVAVKIDKCVTRIAKLHASVKATVDELTALNLAMAGATRKRTSRTSKTAATSPMIPDVISYGMQRKIFYGSVDSPLYAQPYTPNFTHKASGRTIDVTPMPSGYIGMNYIPNFTHHPSNSPFDTIRQPKGLIGMGSTVDVESASASTSQAMSAVSTSYMTHAKTMDAHDRFFRRYGVEYGTVRQKLMSTTSKLGRTLKGMIPAGNEVISRLFKGAMVIELAIVAGELLVAAINKYTDYILGKMSSATGDATKTETASTTSIARQAYEQGKLSDAEYRSILTDPMSEKSRRRAAELQNELFASDAYDTELTINNTRYNEQMSNIAHVSTETLSSAERMLTAANLAIERNASHVGEVVQGFGDRLALYAEAKLKRYPADFVKNLTFGLYDPSGTTLQQDVGVEAVEHLRKSFAGLAERPEILMQEDGRIGFKFTEEQSKRIMGAVNTGDVSALQRMKLDMLRGPIDAVQSSAYQVLIRTLDDIIAEVQNSEGLSDSAVAEQRAQITMDKFTADAAILFGKIIHDAGDLSLNTLQAEYDKLSLGRTGIANGATGNAEIIEIARAGTEQIERTLTALDAQYASVLNEIDSNTDLDDAHRVATIEAVTATYNAERSRLIKLLRENDETIDSAIKSHIETLEATIENMAFTAEGTRATSRQTRGRASSAYETVDLDGRELSLGTFKGGSGLWRQLQDQMRLYREATSADEKRMYALGRDAVAEALEQSFSADVSSRSKRIQARRNAGMMSDTEAMRAEAQMFSSQFYEILRNRNRMRGLNMDVSEIDSGILTDALYKTREAMLQLNKATNQTASTMQSSLISGIRDYASNVDSKGRMTNDALQHSVNLMSRMGGIGLRQSRGAGVNANTGVINFKNAQQAQEAVSRTLDAYITSQKYAEANKGRAVVDIYNLLKSNINKGIVVR